MTDNRLLLPAARADALALRNAVSLWADLVRCCNVVLQRAL
ncbi:MAG TPA: hypothetical protein VER08_10485 [Pyrinomonadaceae bacterium]|nr:hypothetical protein [Pyrinomonadaceae bacterium]